MKSNINISAAKCLCLNRHTDICDICEQREYCDGKLNCTNCPNNTETIKTKISLDKITKL